MELLDYLVELLGCAYLSDLHYRSFPAQQARAVLDIPDGRFPLEQYAVFWERLRCPRTSPPPSRRWPRRWPRTERKDSRKETGKPASFFYFWFCSSHFLSCSAMAEVPFSTCWPARYRCTSRLPAAPVSRRFLKSESFSR